MIERFCSRYAIREHEPAVGTPTPCDALLLLHVPKAQWHHSPWRDQILKVVIKGADGPDSSQSLPITRIRLVWPITVASEKKVQTSESFFLFSETGAFRVGNIGSPNSQANIEALVLKMQSEVDIMEDPIHRYLVCTDGRRDACCAKFGFELATKMSGQTHIEVMQASHLGGDRFAPTVIHLPSGHMFAWVEDYEQIRWCEIQAAPPNIHLRSWRGNIFWGQEKSMITAALIRKGLRNFGSFSVINRQESVNSVLLSVEVTVRSERVREDVRLDSRYFKTPSSCKALDLPDFGSRKRWCIPPDGGAI